MVHQQDTVSPRKVEAQPQPAAEAEAGRVIAHALWDAGTAVLTHVPGFGANQVFDAFRDVSGMDLPVSYHEEVAYTIAHGAALVGRRSAAVIKAHGFAKAANSAVDALVAGTTAGFVTLIVDDPKAEHSDCVFDIQGYLEGLGYPYRRLKDGDLYEQVRAAFDWSEARAQPVALVLEAPDVAATHAFVRREREQPELAFEPDPTRYYLQPVFAAYQADVLVAKQRGEDWRSIPKPALPRIPDGLPEAWLTRMSVYRPFFDVFRELRGEIVTGDTGVSHLFAFPPYDCCDLSTYMGGSVPLAIGAHLAGYRDVWALIGDFAFVSAGHLALAEALQRRTPIKVVVFYNGRAAGTGGQPVSEVVWNSVLAGYQDAVRVIHDGLDRTEIHAALEAAAAAESLQIIVLDVRGAEPRAWKD